MADKVHVVVDAMGGDNAPGLIVKGAVDALNENANVEVTLTGREEDIQKALSGLQYPKDRLHIVHCEEVIEMAEPPVDAIRTKKDSSMVRGLRMVKNGEADAFVTAGSTGAALAGGQLLVGRIRGIERPPLAPILPTAKGPVLLIDCGANMDPRASMLLQFAQMGSIYMSNMTGIDKPRVGLVSVGTEEEKGNALTKEVFPLLKSCETINFVGNIEGRDIPEGAVDVAVTDAFTGNAILKTYEGVAGVLIHELKDAMLSTTRSKAGALLVKPALKDMLVKFDATRYGGAPMLGLKGLVVKTHGNSKSEEIRNAVAQCVLFKEKDINGQFVKEMELGPKG